MATLYRLWIESKCGMWQTLILFVLYGNWIYLPSDLEILHAISQWFIALSIWTFPYLRYCSAVPMHKRVHKFKFTSEFISSSSKWLVSSKFAFSCLVFCTGAIFRHKITIVSICPIFIRTICTSFYHLYRHRHHHRHIVFIDKTSKRVV